MDCPYCKTPNAPGAVRCAACTSWMDLRRPVREWTRSSANKMIAGVCGGLAERFGIPVAALRVAFLLSLIFMWGVGLIVYVALWIAMPLPQPLASVPAPPQSPIVTTTPVDPQVPRS